MKIIKNIIIGLFFISFSTYVETLNKIVYLISPPRSLSTVFARMIHARGDFHVFNEPSLSSFCLIHDPKIMDALFVDTYPKTAQEAQNLLKKQAKISPVFAKEISYSVKDLLLTDYSYIRKPYVYFIILLRNPHASVISFYKKWISMPADFPDDFAKWQGYKETEDIFNHLNTYATNKPCIITSEELFKEPEKTIKHICKQIDIPYLEHSLQWESLSEDITHTSKWIEFKNVKSTHFWHDNALTSKGIVKPTCYDVDNSGNPTFTEITNLDHRLICKEIYDANMVHYNRIIQQKK